MSYGPAEEFEMERLLTDDKGELDLELLIIVLLELRERIKDLEEKVEDANN